MPPATLLRFAALLSIVLMLGAPAAMGAKRDVAAETPSAVAAGGAGWRFLACSGSATSWSTISLLFVPVTTCRLTVPQDGSLLITANGTARLVNGGTAWEGQFRLGVNDLSGDNRTERTIDVAPDSANGSDKTLALSWLQAVGAGTHTVTLFGRRSSLLGQALIDRPRISALYVPRSATDLVTCGSASGADWQTDRGTDQGFGTIASCALAAPQSGLLYISASAAVALPAGSDAYEARLRVGVDSAAGLAASDRYVNVYPNRDDARNEAALVSILTPISAGAHTVLFLGLRQNGIGTVLLQDPTISALFIPDQNASARVCGKAIADTVRVDTTSYHRLAACTIDVARGGWAFVDGSGSAGLETSGVANEYEARFRIDADDRGEPGLEQTLNIAADVGDGTDRSAALAGVVTVQAGRRTFSYDVQRSGGAGVIRVFNPSITVIAPGVTIFLPNVPK